jgi:hypothetical protein
VSVAALQPPATIYREEQYFPWWLYALLAVMVAAGLYTLSLRQAPGPARPGVMPAMEVPLSLLIGVVLPPALVVGVLRMTTEVVPGQCRVSFGILPTYRRAIPLDLVRKIEVTTYRPFRDHRFWGVRTTRDGERVMTARGSRGVRLHLADGSRILIGSQKPEDLAGALQEAMRPVA